VKAYKNNDNTPIMKSVMMTNLKTTVFIGRKFRWVICWILLSIKTSFVWSKHLFGKVLIKTFVLINICLEKFKKTCQELIGAEFLCNRATNALIVKQMCIKLYLLISIVWNSICSEYWKITHARFTYREGEWKTV